MTPAARVLNIIAQDKMDLGTSMESLGSDMVGSFNLNVWFDGNCYTRAVEEYRPGMSGDNKSSALAAGNLIVSGVDVDRADFNITNATTATGRRVVYKELSGILDMGILLICQEQSLIFLKIEPMR